jgi:hypothetical protein
VSASERGKTSRVGYLFREDEPEKHAQQRVGANLARRSNSQSINEKQIQTRKKQKTEQTVYWHRRRWADDKPAGTQIVVVQQIFATPQVDPSKLLEVQEGQYLYLLGCSTDGWAQCQTNELGIPTQIGFVPIQSLALFSEEEVARWSPVAPAPVAAAPVAAAAAPSADELSKLKGPELKGQLRKRGLLLSGKKKELVARLLAGRGRACSFQGLIRVVWAAIPTAFQNSS